MSGDVMSFNRNMIPITDGPNNCTPPPNNPDVQGFVVRLSLFISQVCLVTLLVFSRKGIRTVVGSLLLQNYIILIASLVFIRLGKLSPNDIHFVIGAVNSPVFHMLVWVILLNLVGLIFSNKFAENPFSEFFSPLGPLRLPSQLLILGIIPAWVTLSCVTWFSGSLCVMENHANHICAYRANSHEWTRKLAIDSTWLYLPIMPFFLQLFYLKWPKYRILGFIMGFVLSFLLVWSVVRLGFLRFCVTLYIIFILLTMLWGVDLGVYHLETKYDFTYGQLISIGTCIPSLFLVCKLAWKRYQKQRSRERTSTYELDVIS